MSKTIEIYPSTTNIPTYKEIIRNSIELLNKIKPNEKHNIYLKSDNNLYNEDDELVTIENKYITFNIDNIGELYLYCFKFDSIDYDFWMEEIENNQNAKKLKDRILSCYSNKYYWSIKKTISQPNIAHIFQILISISISNITNGCLYSDDGIINNSILPIEGNDLFFNDMLREEILSLLN